MSEDFKEYNTLAKSVIITAIKDYYNMVNNKGAKDSRNEGYCIRKWLNTNNFILWCDVADYNPKIFKTMFKDLLNRIDSGEIIKGLEKLPKELKGV